MSIFIRVAGPRGRLAALQVRRTVFVEELGLEKSVAFDEHDTESLLFLASQADVPVACARLHIETDEDDLAELISSGKSFPEGDKIACKMA